MVPKAIREAARMEPGTELEVRLVGGVIELTPVPRTVQLDQRGQLTVAVPVEKDRELTQAEVDATLRAVRDRDTETPQSRRHGKES